MDFLLRSGHTWTLLGDTLSDYQSTFRRVAVVSELRKAQLWLVANPARRKTARGMPRFLNAWLAREDRRSPTVGGRRASDPWTCPHDPPCPARWQCAKKDEFDRVKAEVVAQRKSLFPA